MKAVFSLGAALLAFSFLAQPAPAGKDTMDYLTGNGQLKAVLVLKELQGGFAGFTGWQWQVEPDGQWKKFQVFNEKLTEKEKGQLSKEQLASLAKELAKYDLLHLQKKGKVSVNPKTVTVKFGKQEAELVLMGGATLPKADPATVEGRFSGISQAVQSMLKGKKEEN
jgi:hypothetical protein